MNQREPSDKPPTFLIKLNRLDWERNKKDYDSRDVVRRQSRKNTTRKSSIDFAKLHSF